MAISTQVLRRLAATADFRGGGQNTPASDRENIYGNQTML